MSRVIVYHAVYGCETGFGEAHVADLDWENCEILDG